mmetsp:Transcript_11468/g.15874  ORF Transcript_11468/g.15874 Transcript_11468/m.15874 type:complete len:181 (+) Transcript_11468:104-646(+)
MESYTYQSEDCEVNDVLVLPTQASMDECNNSNFEKDMLLMGGAASFSVVRTFPDLLAFRCFCQKCYMANLPDCNTQDFSKCTCCPFKAGCGCEDWKDPTYCQLFCVACASAGPQFFTSIPSCIRIQCLFYKCGVRNEFLMGWKNEIKAGEWCTSMCCCLHNDFGCKDICKIQWLCLLCTF